MKITVFGRTFEFRSGLANPARWLSDFFGGGRRTGSGELVDEFTAMKYSAVWACVLVLSQNVATLPLIVYRRTADGGKERATDHWAYNLLHTLPNPELTSYNWRQVSQGHVASWGNAYSLLEINNSGQVVSMAPLPPDRVRIRIKDGRKWFDYQPKEGPRITYASHEVLHIPGFGYDGVCGYSVISMHREAIGLGKATETFGAKFFGSGTNPGTVFEHPTKLSEEAYKRLSSELQSKAGLSKAFDGMLLEEGLKMQQLGIPPEDAQFLETRQFQVTDVARIFNMPPHKIQDLTNATFSNIEQQSIDFVTGTLLPWLTLWEQELTRQILTPVDTDNGIFVEFLVDGLLRGDQAARYAAYQIGRQGGWLSGNDIRKLENMNPKKGLDEYLVPLNMAPAGDLDDSNARTVAGAQLTTRSSVVAQEKRTREVRSLTNRKRLTTSYKKLFLKAAETIVNREAKALLRIAEKELESRSVGSFKDSVSKFYEDLPRHIQREFAPTVESFAELIRAEVAKELAGDPLVTKQYLRFVDAYVELLAKRWVSSSAGQINKIIDLAEGSAALGEVTARIEQWQERKAMKVARNETVRSSGAFSLESYKDFGATKKKWVTVGDNCPFCDELDGMVVEIEKNFVEAGDGISVDDRDDPLIIYGNHMHPPIHQGCDCQIVAE